MPSLGEAPNVRGKALWLLSRFSKVTRRKGGTISDRYRSNGYVHPQNNHRLTHSHREQAPTGNRIRRNGYVHLQNKYRLPRSHPR
ncbi:hypothetical protein PS934_02010 [Pseudomonas fluorescens]|nr:hypothetical protein PS934_02010 [Pseudomonas fluorescens]